MRTCPACGAKVSASEVLRDDVTGDVWPVPWCPACGTDLPTTPDPSHHQ